ncbi:MAG: hypothetical protein IRY86_05330 [Thermorudis peleae]|nr:hypothetical protein [Thermorudis peleae]
MGEEAKRVNKEIELFPVTIFPNPCSSEAAWLAVACEPDTVPGEATRSCVVLHFWRRQPQCPPIGQGDTPDAALNALLSQLSMRGQPR